MPKPGRHPCFPVFTREKTCYNNRKKKRKGVKEMRKLILIIVLAAVVGYFGYHFGVRAAREAMVYLGVQTVEAAQEPETGFKETAVGWLSDLAANHPDAFYSGVIQKFLPGTRKTAEEPAAPAAVQTEPTEEAPPEPAVPLSDTFYNRIPILMYHVVQDDPNSNSLFLSPGHFQEHLDYMEAAGIHPVTMKQVYDHWYNGAKLPAKPIVLSFDDGYRSMYTEVWPRLKAKNMTGVFYIITSFIGRDTNLTEDMIREMAAGGMEIGSHSVNHLDMSTLSSAQLDSELQDSKGVLEQLTGQPVVSFCYPSGSYGDLAREAVARAGYTTAVTTAYGIAAHGENPYTLSRIRISLGDNGQSLQSKLSVMGEDWQ